MRKSDTEARLTFERVVEDVTGEEDGEDERSNCEFACADEVEGFAKEPAADEDEEEGEGEGEHNAPR